MIKTRETMKWIKWQFIGIRVPQIWVTFSGALYSKVYSMLEDITRLCLVVTGYIGLRIWVEGFKFFASGFGAHSLRSRFFLLLP